MYLFAIRAILVDLMPESRAAESLRGTIAASAKYVADTGADCGDHGKECATGCFARQWIGIFPHLIHALAIFRNMALMCRQWRI